MIWLNKFSYKPLLKAKKKATHFYVGKWSFFPTIYIKLELLDGVSESAQKCVCKKVKCWNKKKISLKVFIIGQQLQT